MSWIHQIPVTEAEGTLARVYQAAQQRSGGVANILQVMSLRSTLLQSFLGLYVHLMKGEGSLPSTERELLATVTSQVNGCHY
ncbi:MAG: carboxymuconolactone decarboxylase family protein [Planctomycetota bacterium]